MSLVLTNLPRLDYRDYRNIVKRLRKLMIFFSFSFFSVTTIDSILKRVSWIERGQSVETKTSTRECKAFINDNDPSLMFSPPQAMHDILIYDNLNAYIPMDMQLRWNPR